MDKKNRADFLSVNTFLPKQTPFLLDLSVLSIVLEGNLPKPGNKPLLWTDQPTNRLQKT